MTLTHLASMLAPELCLMVGATLVLLVGMARGEPMRGLSRVLAIATVFAALAVCATSSERATQAMGVHVTQLTWYVRLIALSIGLVVVLVHWNLPAGDDRGDLFAMILFSLSGILLTSLADDLILLFLAIELVSVPTYVLVSVGRSDIRSQEAGVKYFFLGALSAALLVYGFSFLYGATGTTTLSTMSLSPTSGFATLGLLLAFAGVAFKIAAVPFHVYAADVYQGAASPVTGLLGFFPKLAGFVALIKLLTVVEPASPTAAGWGMMPAAFFFLWIVSAATMTIGNVLGLMQSNVKRMLAYSSIAHSGYMLIGLLAGPSTIGGPLRNGVSAMLFYIVAYGVMNLGAFAVLALLENRGRAAEELEDLHGLGKRQPLAALALAICVFSLMGMPPTAGFLGKVYLFSSALSAGREHPHQTALIVLAVIGVINAAIAAAYYLRIIAACYLGEPESDVRLARARSGVQMGLVACCVAVMLIGLWPRELIRMAPQLARDVRPGIRTTQAIENPAPSTSAPVRDDQTEPRPPSVSQR